tara:strand:- start:716 stop:1921 length:1206 start_codon:yes stop_codon:yes gene_type:complete
MIYGYDPIYLEKIEVNEWLKEDNDNILLVIEDSKDNINFSKTSLKKNKIYCSKKSYLENPNVRDIYLKCVLENDQLLPKKTYGSKTNYFYIGNYINKPIIINAKNITSLLLDFNVFKLVISGEKYDYINKELLQLSHVGLYNQFLTAAQLKKLPKEEQEYIKKQQSSEKHKNNKNLPHNKEVYFENILAKALTDYSFMWDVPVNTYLRMGETYFDNNSFKSIYNNYGSTMQKSIEAVKNKITELDRVFLDAAPRNESLTKTYYRGMTQPFENFKVVGDNMVVKNYLSVSSSFNIAVGFSGITKGKKCCLYKIVIDKGIPAIDMVSTTKYVGERETLLPRNLNYELIDIIKLTFPNVNPKYEFEIYVMKVSLLYKDQFKVKKVCQLFNEAKLEIYKNPPFIK